MSGTLGSAIVSAYTGLITPEHNQQPDYIATVTLSVQPFVDGQNVLLSLPGIFDLDVAVGSQLDTVGAWAGIARYVPVPLTNVYFTWGSSTLGWNQGVWKGPFDPTDGLVTLPDDVYRLVIRTKIDLNNWDGTVPGAAAALANLFNDTVTPGTLIVIQNNQNMTMTIGISGQIPPPVYSSLLANDFFPIKPAGIGINFVETTVNNAPCFGFGVDNEYVGGWGTGAWAAPIEP